MAKRNFLLLSLEDKKAKQVANVVSNASCKKILDYLAENEGTESEIAKKLKIPLSTVHYNLKQLMDAGLVDADEYHYSEKGKEVFHYKLANKYIVIAPKSEKSSLREKLKGILPIGLIALGAAFVIQFTNQFFSKSVGTTQTLSQDMATRGAMEKSIPEIAAVADEAADSVLESAEEEVTVFAAESMPLPDPATVHSTSVFPESIALWFFIGALFTIILFIVFNMRKK